jgi:hypothetical protein
MDALAQRSDHLSQQYLWSRPMPMPLPDHLYVSSPPIVSGRDTDGLMGHTLRAEPAMANSPGWWLIAGLMMSSMAGWLVALAQMR